MKIALITDQHIGFKNDSADYLNYFTRFYENVFFPYLDEHKIGTVIDLGDTLDRRKYVNFNTLAAFHKIWLEPLRDRNITMHCIIGNHQSYYKNTTDINSAALLHQIEGLDMNVYQTPQDVKFDGLSIAMLPWINRENIDDSMEFVKNSKSSVLMGHLELSGYQAIKGITFDHGMDPGKFSKFSRVFSGHFHTKQQKGNVDYLGSPYEMSFADFGSDKGFHIFDTETLEIQFIKNPEKMHIYLPYDDTKVDYIKADIEAYRNKVVKINVIEKNDSYLFEKFIERLVSVNPIKYTIIDNTEVIDFGVADDSYESKDTMSILVDYVQENFEDEHDQSEIIKLMRELYNEAISG